MKTPLIMLGAAVALAGRLAAQAPDGQALYRENCRACHGATGKPPARILQQYPKIPTLSDSAFLLTLSQDSIVAVITHGARNGKDMKPFKDKLTHDQILAVARYVRTLSQPRSTSP